MTKKQKDSPYGCAWSFIIFGAVMMFIGSKYGIYILGIGILLGLLFLWDGTENKGKQNKPVATVKEKRTKYELKNESYALGGIGGDKISESMLGVYVGYARALKPTDKRKYPIGVYGEGNKKIGYILEENEELYNYIAQNIDKMVSARGELEKVTDENGNINYNGTVVITKHIKISEETVDVPVTSLDNPSYKYPIKGINFRELDDTMLGDFMGYVRALKSNPHDKYAIGVYVGNKKVGFLPRDNKELHEKITANGGTAGAEGYIAKGESEDGRLFYYGKVNVLGV